MGTATPPYALPQQAVADFMVRSMQLGDDDARKLRTLFRASGIETRWSFIEDYGKTEAFRFFENNRDLEPFPSTKRRLEVYQRHALALSLDAAHRCLENVQGLRRDSITHLVVVSCTGMYAPGLDIDLVRALGLNSSIERTCINFMGCYAAFNALKLASGACSLHPDNRVLIVCTELCSLHFQKEHSEDNLLANALFGDGAAAVLVENQARPGINLQLEEFHCELATEGEHDMTWSIGDLGFEMRLSSYVPDIIRSGIRNLTRALLAKIDSRKAQVDYYAIHPGGKKILETIESELGLARAQNMHAYDILKRYGNMSSPTVLFVLDAVRKDLKPRDEGKRILSFAFGPGLTMESALFKIAASS